MCTSELRPERRVLVLVATPFPFVRGIVAAGLFRCERTAGELSSGIEVRGCLEFGLGVILELLELDGSSREMTPPAFPLLGFAFGGRPGPLFAEPSCAETGCRVERLSVGDDGGSIILLVRPDFLTPSTVKVDGPSAIIAFHGGDSFLGRASLVRRLLDGGPSFVSILSSESFDFGVVGGCNCAASSKVRHVRIKNLGC